MIVSRGKSGSPWCAFAFALPFPFFDLTERAEVSVGGATGAGSVVGPELVVFCCRVRGAMLVWKDSGWERLRRDSEALETRD